MKDLTLELKRGIIKKYQKGESVSNLSKYYGIPKTSIYNRIDKHTDKSFQELSISKRKIYEYQRKIEKLDREKKFSNILYQLMISQKDIRLIWYNYWKKNNIQSKQYAEYSI